MSLLACSSQHRERRGIPPCPPGNRLGRARARTHVVMNHAIQVLSVLSCRYATRCFSGEEVVAAAAGRSEGKLGKACLQRSAREHARYTCRRSNQTAGSSRTRHATQCHARKSTRPGEGCSVVRKVICHARHAWCHCHAGTRHSLLGWGTHVMVCCCLKDTMSVMFWDMQAGER